MIFVLLFQLLCLSLHANPLLDNFEKQGYHEIQNETHGTLFLNRTYSKLEELATFIETHPRWQERQQKIDRAYLKSAENKIYGEPPIGFVDQSKSGKNKKVYFHYTRDYHHYLRTHYRKQLSKSKPLRNFFAMLCEIASNSEKQFKNSIDALSKDVDLSKVMYKKDGSLALLVKVVRYEKSDQLASSPHVDFSGLSLLYDNNEVEDESLLLTPYKEQISWADFSRAKRKYGRTEKTSSLLLIPGLALKQLSIPINPTPHAVLAQTKVRWAIIVFAMVPDVKLSYQEIQLKLRELDFHSNKDQIKDLKQP
jgi:hypothetical protein